MNRDPDTMYDVVELQTKVYSLGLQLAEAERGRDDAIVENEGLRSDIEKLRNAVRKHRDQRGDDRCWMDDGVLYSFLPEGVNLLPMDTAVELANCERFIASRHNPATTYVSPQRRIEELEEAIMNVKDGLKDLYNAACFDPANCRPDMPAQFVAIAKLSAHSMLAMLPKVP